MAQYTSSDTTTKGTVVNAVLDSVANTITYTVTTASGVSASTTVSSTVDPQSGGSGVIIELKKQLVANNGGNVMIISAVAGFGNALNATYGDVNRKAERAQATATATDTPVANETQPIPTDTNATPVIPTPAQTEQVQNTTPAPDPEYTTDSLGNSYKNGVLYRAAEVVENEQPQSAVGYGDDPGAEYTTDSLGNTYKNGELYRAAEVIENPEPPTATGYGDDPGQEYTTDSLGNVYKNGELYRAAEVNEDPSPANGLQAPKLNTQSQATQQDAANFAQLGDWRVRLALAPGATYLYKNKGNEGILLPLAATDGVIFPYTPAISVQYAASYDSTELTHSNYKFYQYKSSSVENISITCDFTAQDTAEANYLLAVIHFFRSVTKMFYGQDQNPSNGTPPPLCYLYGLGAFQFDNHPLAVTNFTYTLPTDVDYIRAGATTTPPGVSKAPSNVPINSNSVSGDRANNNGLTTGGGQAPPQFSSSDGTRTPTYVPTKMQITISAIPIVTRNDISNNFSLNGPKPNYGSGALLQGTKRKGGGIW
jgi:hypothetical protein